MTSLDARDPGQPRSSPGSTLVRAASSATYIAFIGAGFVFASWASRIPQVRDRLQLDPSALGLTLLAIAAGSVLSLPLAGPVVERWGSRRTVMVTAVGMVVSQLTVAVGYLVGVVPVVVGLFLFGVASGGWDVAMNVQGTVVERHLRRSVMSRYHAGFSLGTVAGALLGALLVLGHVPVTAHLSGVSVAVAVIVWGAARRFLPDGPGTMVDVEGAPGALRAWREPRTLLIGVFVLVFAFIEGAGNDWISIAAIDDHHVQPAVGVLTFALFLGAMTVGRWFGPGVLDRFGRVAVVRALCGIGIAGTALFVFAPPPLAFAGALLWGLGASLGFPVGMSAAADDPRRAAGRVGVVCTIAYCAFFAGPPLIGLLGDHYSVLRALSVVGALLAFAALIATAVAPVATSPDTS